MGNLKTLENHFFCSCSRCYFDLNNKRDAYRLSYVWKAMIICGLSLDFDGIWKVEQLFDNLQDIIKEYCNHYKRESVPQVLTQVHGK